jgi:hypothetical protein
MKIFTFKLFDVTAFIWLSAALLAVTVLQVIAPTRVEAQARRVPTPAPRQTSHEAILERLDDLPPTWSAILPAESRFKLVMGNAAVLDRETGLVWEQSPDTTHFAWGDISFDLFCNDKAVGNRKGWRIPTIEELASLVDPSVPLPGRTLPSGHPFSNVQATYWSANTTLSDTSSAWAVFFEDGAVSPAKKFNGFFLWCVRGGQGIDLQ